MACGVIGGVWWHCRCARTDVRQGSSGWCGTIPGASGACGVQGARCGDYSASAAGWTSGAKVALETAAVSAICSAVAVPDSVSVATQASIASWE